MQSIDDHLEMIGMVSRSVVERGWAEGSSGNLSILINEPDLDDVQPMHSFETGLFLPQLEGKYLLITSAGSRFDDLEKDPEGSLGIYRLGRGGRNAAMVRGSGPPSSEWLTHLMLYACNRSRINSILHCHVDFTQALDRIYLGGKRPLPGWITWVSGIPFGTLELARVTVQEIGNRDTVFWKGHGALTASSDVESALNAMLRFSEWAADPDI